MKAAFLKTRTWPVWNDGPVWKTVCHDCGGEIAFQDGHGYTFKTPPPALSVVPDVGCPTPGCEGAVHFYLRDIVFVKKVRAVPTLVPVGASEEKSLVDRVREKLGRAKVS
jgi:hypothetical protein